MMDDADTKKIITNAVETTRKSWEEWDVSWEDIDDVFLTRAYDQVGFDDWIFVDFLQDNEIRSIDKIGKILENTEFDRKYNRDFAGSLEKPLYYKLKEGKYGKEGMGFYNAAKDFNGRKGASYWRLLWYMLVCCNDLKEYNFSFKFYLKKKYAEYIKLDTISEVEFINISQSQWETFLETKPPWNGLLGVGPNVFDYVMGDAIDLKFVKDSYKLDSANQRFLTITGIYECKPEELDYHEVKKYLKSLKLPYTLREINKGLYAYCNELEKENTHCRKRSKCNECNVEDICQQEFQKFKH
jgi:hypothetical protein